MTFKFNNKFFFALGTSIFFSIILSCSVLAGTVEFPEVPEYGTQDDNYFNYTDYVIIDNEYKYYLTSGQHINHTYYLTLYNKYEGELLTKNLGGNNFNVNKEITTITYMLVDGSWVKCEYIPYTDTLATDQTGVEGYESVENYWVLYNSSAILNDDDGSVYRSVNEYYSGKSYEYPLTQQFSLSPVKSIFSVLKSILPVLLVAVVGYIAFRKAFVFIRNLLTGA